MTRGKCNIKGTVNVISSDPTCNDWNGPFTTRRYPLNPYLIKNVKDTFVLPGLKLDNSVKFSCGRNAQVTFVNKSQLEIISFQIINNT